MLITFLVTVASLWLHELGHAAASRYYRDSYGSRRWTARPFVNLDPVLSVVIPALTSALTKGFIAFGLGRPFVLVKHRWQIAAAGPAVNLLLALALWWVWPRAARINLLLGVVNLIPVRPLDGWWVWELATHSWRARFEDHVERLERRRRGAR